MDPRGRTVLLTGAAGGIGHHIAAALAERGARLVVSDVDDASLAAAALPVDAIRLAADLRDLDAAEGLVARAEQAAGPLDVLVNCAGLEFTGAFAQQDRGSIEDLVGVNLLAPLTLIRAALPGMLARRRGHVVNVTSISGKGAAPYLAVYGTTKAGLIELTRSLRVEHRGTGVSFSAVSPGFVADEGMYARMEGRAPVTLGTSKPARVASGVLEALDRDVPEKLVVTRPMRAFFALTELSPRAGELGIVASGARRFLRRVAERRGTA
jgi:NAD(P)-dependent dehydrogenase (short-subunit alcohol dehydrogenase family)